ncbi:MAG: 2-hydroxyglutaryl-CoA dehydratase [Candidatus Lokiarchaeota archaeon]|nr:2-hydroxyglutaryl-CoA dehydratase [Candidatus Lokiarchaeota archaeon]
MPDDNPLTIGIDVGSTTTKGILLSDKGEVISKHLCVTGSSASKAASGILHTLAADSDLNLSEVYVVSTGYGRRQVDFASDVITEITCHCVGVHYINSGIRLVIDIGGQDSKVIRVSENGRPHDFELNDKCSAGTGRFLEVMARVLGVSLDELGQIALESDNPCTISSTCTVFAESEVIGHIGSGKEPPDIAAGIHLSMASKVGSLARRVGIVPPIALTGGVALNPAFKHYLELSLEHSLWIPDTPQYTGALGAAVLGHLAREKV